MRNRSFLLGATALSLVHCDSYYRLCDAQPELCWSPSYEFDVDAQKTRKTSGSEATKTDPIPATPAVFVDRAKPDFSIYSFAARANTNYQACAAYGTDRKTALKLGCTPLKSLSSGSSAKVLDPIGFGDIPLSLKPPGAPSILSCANPAAQAAKPLPSLHLYLERAGQIGDTPNHSRQLTIIDSRLRTLQLVATYSFPASPSIGPLRRVQLVGKGNSRTVWSTVDGSAAFQSNALITTSIDVTASGMLSTPSVAQDSHFARIVGGAGPTDVRYEVPGGARDPEPTVCSSKSAYLSACLATQTAPCAPQALLPGVCFPAIPGGIALAPNGQEQVLAVTGVSSALQIFSVTTANAATAPMVTVKPKPSTATTQVRLVVFGDLDGEGDLDLLALRPNQPPAVLLASATNFTAAPLATLGQFRRPDSQSSTPNLLESLEHPQAVAAFAHLNFCGTGSDLLVANGSALYAIYAQDGLALVGKSTQLAAKQLLELAVPAGSEITAIDVTTEPDGSQLVLLAAKPPASGNPTLHLYKLAPPSV